MPVVACLGESVDGQILNVNGDVAAGELAVAMRPGKIVFLTPTGGLLDDRGQIMPAINLVEEGDALLAKPWVGGGMALKIRQIDGMLERLPADASVSITSPGHLARELFTHRGCGTLVRRGEPIRVHGSLGAVDRVRLRETLESSFRRRLAPEYFDTIDPRMVLVAGDYVAAAVITEQAGVPYLDKFAVTARAQGLGVGASLWSRIRASTPSLFWRSRRDNAINPWYFKQAEGMERTGQWVVFWYGLNDRELIGRCIEHAPSTCRSRGSPTAATPAKAQSLCPLELKRSDTVILAALRSATRTVGVVGARGHVGAELLRLLARHPRLELAFASSRTKAGQPLPDGLCGPDRARRSSS